MSEQSSHPPHVLLMAAAGQGHINPTLQLAKTIARAGIRVTFATTLNNLQPINLHLNISIATFSSGYEDGVRDPSDDPHAMAEKVKRVGAKSLRELLTSSSTQGNPVTFLVYAIMLPWAADVARELHIPSALLCIQSATTFAIYERYFNYHNGDDDIKSPPRCIELPGLPLFESADLPTFLLPTSPYYFAVPTMEEHIRALEKDSNPTVLINSFDAFEEHVVRAFDNHRIKMMNIGPLIPSAYSDMIEPSDTSYGCDLFERSKEYLPWLDAKENKSVVYVSFGSMFVMKRKLFEEVLHGLVSMGRPYLWVVRPTSPNDVMSDEDGVVIEDVIKNGVGPIGGPNDQGMIVPWCSQLEVLSHPSIGCFVTHCGWNSVLESLVSGVPIVGVPQISDQPTNAKLVEEVWRVGVKAKANDENVVDREEVSRCVELVMGHGEIGDKIRRNSMKWMELALESVMEGGSSNANISCFLRNL